ncbi:retrovirus-related pol polyprotein from transposon TNT 1-94 [Tanacetum coccineum]
MSTPVNTSSTDSQMHNNIMAAGSKDRPPMLGPGRYSQWRSRFLRYIDTKANGEYLRKCIFDGPYKLTSVVITVNALAVPEHDEAETVHNMSEKNKLYFKAEKEAIFLLLTSIGDEIYSTVDACNTANKMWTTIERLQQGESFNIQDVKTNLFWEFGKFTSRDGESIESYYSRFYKLMNELTRNNLQVITMQVNVQFLHNFKLNGQDDASIKMKLMIFRAVIEQSKISNPLALLAAAQPYSDNYYQAPKPQRSNATSSSTRPSVSTRHKGKEILKPVTPQSENKIEDTTPRYNNDNQLGQFGNQRTMIVVGTRETVGSPVVQQNRIQCFNYKGFGHYAKECRKLKRVKDYSYHKEKMMMCKQAEHGVPLQAEQADWLADTDEEIDEQELEAHYSFMAKIQRYLNDVNARTKEPKIVQLIYHMLTLEHKAHDGQSQVVAYFVDISGYCSFWKYPICATNLGVMEI